MRPAGVKQFGSFTVQRHQEADPVTGQPKVTGSRISGPGGTFKVPHWPNRITGVTEANGRVFVDVKDGSRPYLTADDDRLTESQISRAERLDDITSPQTFSEVAIGQLRYLVHSFKGQPKDAARRLVEGGLNQSTADRLAAWLQQQSQSMTKWRGLDSGMRESDPVVINRSFARAPLRLVRDAPQLPDGFLESYVGGMLGDEQTYEFASGVKLEVVRGENPFSRLYEHDAKLSAELIGDTEVAMSEAVRRQDDCSPLVIRWLALHGDNRPLLETDAHLVHSVAERVTTGHGPAQGRSQLDQRVIAAQLLGAGPMREAVRVQSGGTITAGDTLPGAGRAAGAVHAMFNEGTMQSTQLPEAARLKAGDIARCGHKIREGRRTCPHCGTSYDRMSESPWTQPEDVVRALAQQGPWVATVERARKDLGYHLIEGYGGFRLEREGLARIEVAVAGEQITEARLVETATMQESAARGGWKPESDEHEESVRHHTEKFLHHDKRRKHFSGLAVEAESLGAFEDARKHHDRAAHHRRAAEQHARHVTASRDLQEYGAPGLPESPIDAGEADTPFKDMMGPKDADEYGQFMEEAERRYERVPSKLSAVARLRARRAGERGPRERVGNFAIQHVATGKFHDSHNGLGTDGDIWMHQSDAHEAMLARGLHPRRHRVVEVAVTADRLHAVEGGLTEADFLEAKHKGKKSGRCPQCDMLLQDPKAKKCPRCGESLRLSKEDKRVDGLMARGDSRSTSPRIKHNPHYDVGEFAESVVDEVLGGDDALEEMSFGRRAPAPARAPKQSFKHTSMFKSGGDDAYSWAVTDKHGRRMDGMSKREASYHRKRWENLHRKAAGQPLMEAELHNDTGERDLSAAFDRAREFYR
jgi:hypothetical protein